MSKTKTLPEYKGEAFYDEGYFYQVYTATNGSKWVAVQGYLHSNSGGKTGGAKSLFAGHILRPICNTFFDDITDGISDGIKKCATQLLDAKEYKKATKEGLFSRQTKVLAFKDVSTATPDGYYYTPKGFMGEGVYAVISYEHFANGNSNGHNVIVEGLYDTFSEAQVEFQKQKEEILDTNTYQHARITSNSSEAFSMHSFDENKEEYGGAINSVYIFNVDVSRKLTKDKTNISSGFFMVYGLNRNGIIFPTAYKSKSEAEKAAKDVKEKIEEYYQNNDEKVEFSDDCTDYTITYRADTAEECSLVRMSEYV